MKLPHLLMFVLALITLRSSYTAQGDPRSENATAAVLRAFETHDLVMIGEIHGNKQEYDWLRSLVASPEFANRVNDIVVEFGNSLFRNR